MNAPGRAFAKTEAIDQGRRIARYIIRNAFQARGR